MRDIPLKMFRGTMIGLPEFDCPPGFSIRSYEPGDETHWFDIEVAAGAFKTLTAAQDHFGIEFAPVVDRLPGRMLFLCQDGVGPIGTTTAWDGDFHGRHRGRIHWVGIVPEFQSKGLAKPLLSAAVQRLAEDFDSTYITTETTSYRGINLYLGFGFEPVVESDLDREGWQIVESVLGKQIL